LLGVTVVNSAGERVQGGGRVVKNVAGYDLPKLYCGARGTLGLITEVTVRVAPLPAASATSVLPLPADVNAEDVLDTLAASALEPSFICLVSPLAAPHILPEYDDAQYLVVGMDGSEAAVASQVQTLGAGQLETDTAEHVRTALRDWELADAPLSVLFNVLPSQVGAFSRMLEWTARRAGFAARVVSDAVLGIMRVHIDGEGDWLALWPDFQDKAERIGFCVHMYPVWDKTHHVTTFVVTSVTLCAL
jgi:FAD/FMN-containing dehydrogenase